MATDEDERRYTMENPHPADEDLSPELKEFIYGNPDEMPELEWPDEDEQDPFIHGGRVGTEGDGCPRDEGVPSVATDEREHHPAVEEFISGGRDELPELPDPSENGEDPFIHGGRIGVEEDE